MNKALIVFVVAAIASACNSAAPIAQNSTAINANGTPERIQTAIAHNTEIQAPPSAPPAGGTTSHWKQSGEPIDTKPFDTTIAAAEIALKKNPSSDDLKKKLGDAYFKRAMALTDPARQYASALGDFRRAVKYDPSNATAKEWIDKIIAIYDSMNREYPKEGEEPPPLTLDKGKQ